MVPSVFVFCKMNMFLLPSLSNMINDSTSRGVERKLVGGRLVGGSVVRGFNKTLRKACLW